MYVINVDGYKSIGSHWIVSYVNNNNNRRASHNAIYFDSFGVEHIKKQIKKLIGNKNIITNVYRIQEYDSTICGYFSIGFVDFMLKGKTLLDYTNLLSLSDYKNNNKIILNYFQWVKRWKIYIFHYLW